MNFSGIFENRFIYKIDRVGGGSFRLPETKFVEPAFNLTDEQKEKTNVNFDRKERARMAKDQMEKSLDIKSAAPRDIKKLILRLSNTENSERVESEIEEIGKRGYATSSNLPKYVKESEIDSLMMNPYLSLKDEVKSLSSVFPKGVSENFDELLEDETAILFSGLMLEHGLDWMSGDRDSLMILLNEMNGLFTGVKMKTIRTRMKYISNFLPDISRYHIPDNRLEEIVSNYSLNIRNSADLSVFIDLNSFISAKPLQLQQNLMDDPKFIDKTGDLLLALSNGDEAGAEKVREEIDAYLFIPVKMGSLMETPDKDLKNFFISGVDKYVLNPLNVGSLLDDSDPDLKNFMMSYADKFSYEQILIYWEDIARGNDLWNMSPIEMKTVFFTYVEIQLLEPELKELNLKIYEKRQYAMSKYVSIRTDIQSQMKLYGEYLNNENIDEAERLRVNVEMAELALDYEENEFIFSAFSSFLMKPEQVYAIDDLTFLNIDFLMAQRGVLAFEDPAMENRIFVMETNFASAKSDYEIYLADNDAMAKLGVETWDENGPKRISQEEGFTDIYFERINKEISSFSRIQEELDSKIIEEMYYFDSILAGGFTDFSTLPSNIAPSVLSRLDFFQKMIDQSRQVNMRLRTTLSRFNKVSNSNGFELFYNVFENNYVMEKLGKVLNNDEFISFDERYEEYVDDDLELKYKQNVLQKFFEPRLIGDVIGGEELLSFDDRVERFNLQNEKFKKSYFRIYESFLRLKNKPIEELTDVELSLLVSGVQKMDAYFLFLDDFEGDCDMQKYFSSLKGGKIRELDLGFVDERKSLVKTFAYDLTMYLGEKASLGSGILNERIYTSPQYSKMIGNEIAEDMESVSSEMIGFVSNAKGALGVWEKLGKYSQIKATEGERMAVIQMGMTQSEIFENGVSKYESLISGMKSSKKNLISARDNISELLNPSDPKKKAELDKLYELNPGLKEQRERMLFEASKQINVLLSSKGPFSDENMKIYNEQYEQLNDRHIDFEEEWMYQQIQTGIIVVASVAVAMATAGLAGPAIAGLALPGFATSFLTSAVVAGSITLVGQPLGMMAATSIGYYTGNEKLYNSSSYESMDSYYTRENLWNTYKTNLMYSVVGNFAAGQASKFAQRNFGTVVKISNHSGNSVVHSISHFGKEIGQEFVEEFSSQNMEIILRNSGMDQDSASFCSGVFEVFVGTATGINVNIDANNVLADSNLKLDEANIFVKDGEMMFSGDPQKALYDLQHLAKGNFGVTMLADGSIELDLLANVLLNGKSKVPAHIMAATGGKFVLKPAGLNSSKTAEIAETVETEEAQEVSEAVETIEANEVLETSESQDTSQYEFAENDDLVDGIIDREFVVKSEFVRVLNRFFKSSDSSILAKINTVSENSGNRSEVVDEIFEELTVGSILSLKQQNLVKSVISKYVGNVETVISLENGKITKEQYLSLVFPDLDLSSKTEIKTRSSGFDSVVSIILNDVDLQKVMDKYNNKSSVDNTDGFALPIGEFGNVIVVSKSFLDGVQNSKKTDLEKSSEIENFYKHEVNHVMTNYLSFTLSQGAAINNVNKSFENGEYMEMLTNGFVAQYLEVMNETLAYVSEKFDGNLNKFVVDDVILSKIKDHVLSKYNDILADLTSKISSISDVNERAKFEELFLKMKDNYEVQISEAFDSLGSVLGKDNGFLFLSLTSIFDWKKLSQQLDFYTKNPLLSMKVQGDILANISKKSDNGSENGVGVSRDYDLSTFNENIVPAMRISQDLSDDISSRLTFMSQNSAVNFDLKNGSYTFSDNSGFSFDMNFENGKLVISSDVYAYSEELSTYINNNPDMWVAICDFRDGKKVSIRNNGDGTCDFWVEYMQFGFAENLKLESDSESEESLGDGVMDFDESLVDVMDKRLSPVLKKSPQFSLKNGSYELSLSEDISNGEVVSKDLKIREIVEINLANNFTVQAFRDKGSQEIILKTMDAMTYSLKEGESIIFGRGNEETLKHTENKSSYVHNVDPFYYGVSGAHVRMYVQDGKLLIEDLNFKNGSKISDYKDVTGFAKDFNFNDLVGGKSYNDMRKTSNNILKDVSTLEMYFDEASDTEFVSGVFGNLFTNEYFLSTQSDVVAELYGKYGYNVLPKKSVYVDGKMFFLSNVINHVYQESRNGVLSSSSRPHVVMYYVENGKLIPRLVYKSNSNGVWRFTAGFNGQIYFKGVQHNYTQETQLNKDILVELDRLPLGLVYKVGYDEKALLDSFKLKSYDDIQSYSSEFEQSSADAKLKPLLEVHEPGDEKNYTTDEMNGAIEEFRKNEESLKSRGENFMVDFSTNPKVIDKYFINHTILGECKVEVFQTKLDGRPVEWHFATSANGEIWINKISFMDSKVNSYGGNREIINSGFLTMKPVEYSKYVSGFETDFVDRIDGNYYNQSRVLDKISVINEYRKFRGIERVERKGVSTVAISDSDIKSGRDEYLNAPTNIRNAFKRIVSEGFRVASLERLASRLGVKEKLDFEIVVDASGDSKHIFNLDKVLDNGKYVLDLNDRINIFTVNGEKVGAIVQNQDGNLILKFGDSRFNIMKKGDSFDLLGVYNGLDVECFYSENGSFSIRTFHSNSETVSKSEKSFESKSDSDSAFRLNDSGIIFDDVTREKLVENGLFDKVGTLLEKNIGNLIERKTLVEKNLDNATDNVALGDGAWYYKSISDLFSKDVLPVKLSEYFNGDLGVDAEKFGVVNSDVELNTENLVESSGDEDWVYEPIIRSDDDKPILYFDAKFMAETSESLKQAVDESFAVLDDIISDEVLKNLWISETTKKILSDNLQLNPESDEGTKKVRMDDLNLLAEIDDEQVQDIENSDVELIEDMGYEMSGAEVNKTVDRFDERSKYFEGYHLPSYTTLFKGNISEGLYMNQHAAVSVSVGGIDFVARANGDVLELQNLATGEMIELHSGDLKLFGSNPDVSKLEGFEHKDIDTVLLPSDALRSNHFILSYKDGVLQLKSFEGALEYAYALKAEQYEKVKAMQDGGSVYEGVGVLDEISLKQYSEKKGYQFVKSVNLERGGIEKNISFKGKDSSIVFDVNGKKYVCKRDANGDIRFYDSKTKKYSEPILEGKIYASNNIPFEISVEEKSLNSRIKNNGAESLYFTFEISNGNFSIKTFEGGTKLSYYDTEAKISNKEGMYLDLGEAAQVINVGGLKYSVALAPNKMDIYLVQEGGPIEVLGSGSDIIVDKNGITRLGENSSGGLIRGQFRLANFGKGKISVFALGANSLEINSALKTDYVPSYMDYRVQQLKKGQEIKYGEKIEIDQEYSLDLSRPSEIVFGDNVFKFERSYSGALIITNGNTTFNVPADALKTFDFNGGKVHFSYRNSKLYFNIDADLSKMDLINSVRFNDAQVRVSKDYNLSKLEERGGVKIDSSLEDSGKYKFEGDLDSDNFLNIAGESVLNFSRNKDGSLLVRYGDKGLLSVELKPGENFVLSSLDLRNVNKNFVDADVELYFDENSELEIRYSSKNSDQEVLISDFDFEWQSRNSDYLNGQAVDNESFEKARSEFLEKSKSSAETVENRFGEALKSGVSHVFDIPSMGVDMDLSYLNSSSASKNITGVVRCKKISGTDSLRLSMDNNNSEIILKEGENYVLNVSADLRVFFVNEGGRLRVLSNTSEVFKFSEIKADSKILESLREEGYESFDVESSNYYHLNRDVGSEYVVQVKDMFYDVKVLEDSRLEIKSRDGRVNEKILLRGDEYEKNKLRMKGKTESEIDSTTLGGEYHKSSAEVSLNYDNILFRFEFANDLSPEEILTRARYFNIYGKYNFNNLDLINKKRLGFEFVNANSGDVKIWSKGENLDVHKEKGFDSVSSDLIPRGPDSNGDFSDAQEREFAAYDLNVNKDDILSPEKERIYGDLNRDFNILLNSSNPNSPVFNGIKHPDGSISIELPSKIPTEMIGVISTVSLGQGYLFTLYPGSEYVVGDFDLGDSVDVAVSSKLLGRGNSLTFKLSESREFSLTYNYSSKEHDPRYVYLVDDVKVLRERNLSAEKHYNEEVVYREKFFLYLLELCKGVENEEDFWTQNVKRNASDAFDQDVRERLVKQVFEVYRSLSENEKTDLLEGKGFETVSSLYRSIKDNAFSTFDDGNYDVDVKKDNRKFSLSLSVDEAKESNLDVLKRVFSAIGRLENIANNLDESDKFLSGMIAGLDLKDEKLKDVFMQVLEKPENVFQSFNDHYDANLDSIDSFVGAKIILDSEQELRNFQERILEYENDERVSSVSFDDHIERPDMRGNKYLEMKLHMENGVDVSVILQLRGSVESDADVNVVPVSENVIPVSENELRLFFDNVKSNNRYSFIKNSDYDEAMSLIKTIFGMDENGNVSLNKSVYDNLDFGEFSSDLRLLLSELEFYFEDSVVSGESERDLSDSTGVVKPGDISRKQINVENTSVVSTAMDGVGDINESLSGSEFPQTMMASEGITTKLREPLEGSEKLLSDLELEVAKDNAWDPGHLEAARLLESSEEYKKMGQRAEMAKVLKKFKLTPDSDFMNLQEPGMTDEQFTQMVLEYLTTDKDSGEVVVNLTDGQKRLVRQRVLEYRNAFDEAKKIKNGTLKEQQKFANMVCKSEFNFELKDQVKVVEGVFLEASLIFVISDEDYDKYGPSQGVASDYGIGQVIFIRQSVFYGNNENISFKSAVEHEEIHMMNKIFEQREKWTVNNHKSSSEAFDSGDYEAYLKNMFMSQTYYVQDEITAYILNSNNGSNIEEIFNILLGNYEKGVNSELKLKSLFNNKNMSDEKYYNLLDLYDSEYRRYRDVLVDGLEIAATLIDSGVENAHEMLMLTPIEMWGSLLSYVSVNNPEVQFHNRKFKGNRFEGLGALEVKGEKIGVFDERFEAGINYEYELSDSILYILNIPNEVKGAFYVLKNGNELQISVKNEYSLTLEDGGPEIIIGRSSKANLVVDSSSLSNEHFAIKYSNGKLILRDLGSEHGLSVLDYSLELPVYSEKIERRGAYVFDLDGKNVEVLMNGEKFYFSKSIKGESVDVYSEDGKLVSSFKVGNKISVSSSEGSNIVVNDDVGTFVCSFLNLGGGRFVAEYFMGDLEVSSVNLDEGVGAVGTLNSVDGGDVNLEQNDGVFASKTESPQTMMSSESVNTLSAEKNEVEKKYIELAKDGMKDFFSNVLDNNELLERLKAVDLVKFVSPEEMAEMVKENPNDAGADGFIKYDISDEDVQRYPVVLNSDSRVETLHTLFHEMVHLMTPKVHLHSWNSMRESAEKTFVDYIGAIEFERFVQDKSIDSSSISFSKVKGRSLFWEAVTDWFAEESLRTVLTDEDLDEISESGYFERHWIYYLIENCSDKDGMRNALKKSYVEGDENAFFMFLNEQIGENNYSENKMYNELLDVMGRARTDESRVDDWIEIVDRYFK